MLNEEIPTKYPEFEDIDALSGSQEEGSAFEGEEGDVEYEDEEGVEQEIEFTKIKRENLFQEIDFTKRKTKIVCTLG